MKRYGILLVVMCVSLGGCGMSDTERENVASVTCSIISETRNMDAAIRVEKINDARTALGEDPYLDGDDGIKESLEFGMCEELVLNDSDYTTKLEELMFGQVADENAEENARLKRISDLKSEFSLPSCPQTGKHVDFDSFRTPILAAMEKIAEGKKLPLEDEKDLEKVLDLKSIMDECAESRSWIID